MKPREHFIRSRALEALRKQVEPDLEQWFNGGWSDAEFIALLSTERMRALNREDRSWCACPTCQDRDQPCAFDCEPDARCQGCHELAELDV